MNTIEFISNGFETIVFSGFQVTYISRIGRGQSEIIDGEDWKWKRDMEIQETKCRDLAKSVLFRLLIFTVKLENEATR